MFIIPLKQYDMFVLMWPLTKKCLKQTNFEQVPGKMSKLWVNRAANYFCVDLLKFINPVTVSDNLGGANKGAGNEWKEIV